MRGPWLPVLTAVLLPWCGSNAFGGDVRVTLQDTAVDFDQVGLVRRWDELGLPLGRVDPKARIDTPKLSVPLRRGQDGVWQADGVPDGTYDLCLVSRKRAVRIEGFHFPPVIDFDPIWRKPPTPPADAVRFVHDWVKKTRFYENKVTPLYIAGNEQTVRVFVQLLRDTGTTYDAQYGAPVATLRYEFWQFTNRLGVWDKERRTRLIYRLIMPRDELARWHWLWSPELGGIEVKGTVRVRLKLPSAEDPNVAGLLPGRRPKSARQD